ncbi:hypothetical protein EOB59_06650 [Mesorhizobium sp. M7A.F.Ca.MR.176.00.0.0]|uniref:hypothetical protein n=1 Tax=Mesorhizobium sp. M7A.F.Ca.MR.176.00.0.0 TaxID=2496776 RepID=UPI000FD381C3|nr:hypothetical protein [Mesorhizobium sp. M7A.F.Ca.MR.176.00.0.0]RUU92654.1 hypothetical protein EOB59_06650 [Mesorhizobium sp. M7A.F.Ca.MR.176.00.0.0]
MIVGLLNRKSRVGKATLTLLLVGELAGKGNLVALLAALVLLKCNRLRSMDWLWPSFWPVSAKHTSAGPSGARFVLDGDSTAARETAAPAGEIEGSRDE